MADIKDRHIGQRLREARLAKGLTQTDLGQAIGVSYQQIQKYERGSNRIASSVLWDACEVLNVTIAYFFEGLSSRQGATGIGEPRPGLSKDAINIAQEIDAISDSEVKTHFLRLIKKYNSSR